MKRKPTGSVNANTVIAIEVVHIDGFVDVRCYVEGQRDWCRLRFTPERAEGLASALRGIGVAP